jgi:hypothetical protein
MAIRSMKTGVYLLVALAVALAAGSAMASISSSDTLTVFNPTGVEQLITAQEGLENSIGDTVHILVVPGIAGGTHYGHPTLVYEEGPENSRMLSDIFGVTTEGETGSPYNLAFMTDREDATEGEIPTDVARAMVLFGWDGREASAFAIYREPLVAPFADATPYLDASLVTQGYTATFRSDSNIPEPATLAIWGLLGALGIAFGWSRRRKSA